VDMPNPHAAGAHVEEPAAGSVRRHQTAPATTAVMAQGAGGDNLPRHTRGLKKVDDGRAVVNGVDIEVKPGEIVGPARPDGAGKTTSFYMIVGLVQPNGGQVMFEGNDVTNEPMYVRRRLGTGYLPQEESIFRCRDRAGEHPRCHGDRSSSPSRNARSKARRSMEKFGIDHVAETISPSPCRAARSAASPSRGHSSPSRSYSCSMSPSAAWTPSLSARFRRSFVCCAALGSPFSITDHNVRETLSIVDRAYLIYEGQVKRHGSQDFLVNDPVARQLYFGEDFKM